MGNTNCCQISGQVPISCDQVVWLLDIADRYIPLSIHPRVSQERDMKKFAMLYEIMEIAGLCFSDEEARQNGTPPQVRG